MLLSLVVQPDGFETRDYSVDINGLAALYPCEAFVLRNEDRPGVQRTGLQEWPYRSSAVRAGVISCEFAKCVF